MFTINDLQRWQEAREDKIAKLAKGLKESEGCERLSRKTLRELLGRKRCSKNELAELESRLEANNIIVIGNLTLRQEDYVHLLYRYSSLYKKLKSYLENEENETSKPDNNKPVLFF